MNQIQNNQNLSGFRVLITGSTSGIGYQTAQLLAKSGANIILSGYHKSDRADQLTNEIRSISNKPVCFISADITDPSQVSCLAQQAWEWQNGIDGLVNCAGADILTGKNRTLSFDEKLDLLWRTDVLGTIALSRMIGTRMYEQLQSHTSNSQPDSSIHTGSIVNIGWDGSRRGLTGDSGQLFAVVKGAIESFSRSLAQQLAPLVRVNTVAPGWIITKWGSQAADQFQQRVLKQALLQRWGKAEEIAAAIAFLLSPQASYINGQTLDVNGGFNAS